VEIPPAAIDDRGGIGLHLWQSAAVEVKREPGLAGPGRALATSGSTPGPGVGAAQLR